MINSINNSKVKLLLINIKSCISCKRFLKNKIKFNNARTALIRALVRLIEKLPLNKINNIFDKLYEIK